VFQFESDGMREALRKVRPTEFEDLVALVALYRPGAMRHIDTYARNKRNPERVTYVDERLRPVTESTYSVILYQEQSMQIAKDIAHFSGPEADDLRKAIGKKLRDKMASLRERFVAGARATGTPEAVIKELWAANEAAADYSFNKAHAACYALIAYRTAWLKANYPAEYMAALISSVMQTKDKVPFFVSRCEEMGIEVLPPDVNSSGHDFVVMRDRGDGEEGARIRFGLDAVKNVGGAAVDAILAAREEDGAFHSIWDFCERVDCRAVNKRAIESLVSCGALDSTGATRSGMLEVLEQAQATGSKVQQDALLGQGSIFDFGDLEPDPAGASGESGSGFRHELPVPSLPDSRKDLNAWEKETLGLFLSSHPLKEVRPALRARIDCGLAELADRRDGDWVTVGGMIAECKRIRTRKGEPMMFATLDDLEGQVEILVFNSAYAQNADKIDVDSVVLVRGRVDHKEGGETKLVVQEVEAFEPAREEVESAAQLAAPSPPPRLRLQLTASVPAAFLDELREVVTHFPGRHELVLEVGERTLVLGPDFRVTDSSAFRADVMTLAGGGLSVA
jgi:DNA polymerase III subunit alpha